MSDEPRIETRLGHLPALDGVRGLAVIIVLLYHHSITWMTGGELTVSMYFTLSGFTQKVALWGTSIAFACAMYLHMKEPDSE